MKRMSEGQNGTNNWMNDVQSKIDDQNQRKYAISLINTGKNPLFVQILVSPKKITDDLSKRN